MNKKKKKNIKIFFITKSLKLLVILSLSLSLFYVNYLKLNNIFNNLLAHTHTHINAYVFLFLSLFHSFF